MLRQRLSKVQAELEHFETLEVGLEDACQVEDIEAIAEELRETGIAASSGRVKARHVGDCFYPAYTLSTKRDRYGAPLVIRQQGGPGVYQYLPLLYVREPRVLNGND